MLPPLGWDLGSGKPLPLPVTNPFEIALVKAHHAALVPSVASTVFDIWGFHPWLQVVVTFYKRVRLDLRDPYGSGPYPDSQLGGKLQAFPLVKTQHPEAEILQLPEFPVAAWWTWSELGVAGLYNGFEASTGAQGIRTVITADVLGSFDHDLVATVQAFPKKPICPDLAKELVDQIRIIPVNPIVFP